MADNSRKTSLAHSLNSLAMRRANDAIQILGKTLPARVVSVQGQIATVAFELDTAPFTLPNVQVPISTSKYDWIPYQKDDKGLLVPSDVYLGGISGLGGGTADYPQRGNLSTLQFHPTSNKEWSDSDSNFRITQGPDGVIIRDTEKKCTIKITKTDITITVQSGKKVTITGGGSTAAVSTVSGPSPVLFADHS